mmetsp:Transcript_61062/g.109948  ORF Transcript_61062/g.109948 Transcript_61062/m.109948 type:complete len:472 (-) Transcript_61062:48-1463(-)
MSQRPSTCIADVVNSIGFGQAQIFTEILAHGVWVADGIELTMVTALTQSIAMDMNLDGMQKASLASVVFVGITVGAGLGGYYGDRVGRRLPVLCSYLGSALCGLASTVAWNYLALLSLRFLLGVAMGLGMPSSLALVSEMSPVAWRAPLMGMRGIMFAIGNMLAAFIMLLDDQTLARLNWRQDLAFGTIPSIFLGLMAFMHLRESPLFLASIGQHDSARQVLEWIKQQNGCDDVSVDYQISPTCIDDHESGYQKPWAHQLNLIFSKPFAYCTCVLCLVTFTFNFVEYGSAYAEPMVLQTTHANMPAAWQLFLKHAMSLPLRLGIAGISVLMSRKHILIVALLAMFCGVLFFATAGGLLHRSPFLTLVYYTGLYLPLAGCALACLAAYQLSVEIYPVVATATGSAFCVGFGRLGSIASPFLYELTREVGPWQNFYYLMAAVCLPAAAFSAFLPHEIEASLKHDDEEAKSLLH